MAERKDQNYGEYYAVLEVNIISSKILDVSSDQKP